MRTQCVRKLHVHDVKPIMLSSVLSNVFTSSYRNAQPLVQETAESLTEPCYWSRFSPLLCPGPHVCSKARVFSIFYSGGPYFGRSKICLARPRPEPQTLEFIFQSHIHLTPNGSPTLVASSSPMAPVKVPLYLAVPVVLPPLHGCDVGPAPTHWWVVAMPRAPPPVHPVVGGLVSHT